jgi:hypothetical protein
MRAACALLLLAGCAEPRFEETMPDGNLAVVTWGRQFGIEATKHDNRKAAERACPDGYILLNETFGRDRDGIYRRWEYACLGKDGAATGSSG